MFRIGTAFAIALGAAGIAAADPAALPTDAAVALGDAAAGAQVFADECGACHEIGPDAAISVGPPLARIFDRRAGSVPGYDYSDSLARMGADGLTWRLATLDAYVADPVALLSGTKMAYPGLPDTEARANLLAFLRAGSDRPQDIPEASPTARAAVPDLPAEIIAIAGDPAYGEYLAAECSTCHQRDGSVQGIPSITGWPTANFVAAMHAYKTGLRPHPGMQMMAKRLDDEQIAALAAYYARN